MDNATSRVVARFVTAFRERDPSLIPELVAEHCVMEGMQPAPDGARVEGYADNVRTWQAMVTDTRGTFESEQTIVVGDRAIDFWRYRYGDRSSVRGVTLVRVEDGKIVEALGYAKTPPIDVDTADVIRRFNDVFQRHDPSALAELVAEDCVVENTVPAPDGARYEGRDACVGLWTRIATDPALRFDVEDVVIAGERATVRWRLWWGERVEASMRGVSLVRVREGRIVESLGYAKVKS